MVRTVARAPGQDIGAFARICSFWVSTDDTYGETVDLHQATSLTCIHFSMSLRVHMRLEGPDPK